MNKAPDPNRGIQVLLVEDDPALRAMLLAVLRTEGFAVHQAGSLQSARAALDEAQQAQTLPDLVILDLNLPDGQGGELFESHPILRTTATLVISARGEEANKIALLDAGAHDYLVKPFGVGELLARIRVALRRRPASAPVQSLAYAYKGLSVDLDKHRVIRDGEVLKLTPTEFKIVAVLANKAGSVVTHRQLLVDVWGAEYSDHTHYLRVYVGNLRAKLEKDPAQPQYLQTEVGVGYRLAVD